MTIDNDMSLRHIGRLEAILYQYIFARRVVFTVVAVADVEGSVGIFVVDVVGTRFIKEGIDLIVTAVSCDVVNAHCRVAGIEYFELAILIAALENKFATMMPFKSISI